MRRAAVVLLFALSLASCSDEVQIGLIGLVHYDDFPGATVDLTKWTVDTTGNGSTGTSSVTVANGQATLDLTAVSGDIQSSLEFPTGIVTRIGHLGTRATTLSYTQGGGSNVRFRMLLRAYKDNKLASGAPPDLTSDIFAQLRVRDAAGTLQFQAMVSRCLDPVCSSELPLPATSLGTAVLGQTYDLSLSWNGDTVFAFSVTGVGTLVFDASEGGVYSNIGASGNPRAQVEGTATSGAPTTGNVTTVLDFVDCGRWDGGLC